MKFRAALLFAVAMTLQHPNAMLSAHHSFAGEFDNSTSVNVRGTVTRVEMVNPHSFIYVDVTTARGVERWALEGSGTAQIARRGLDLQTIKKAGARLPPAATLVDAISSSPEPN